MTDRAQTAVVAHWLTQLKLAKRKREEAGRDAQKWLRRAELALEAGESALVGAAREKALEARARYEEATRHLQSVEVELEAAKRELKEEPTRRDEEFDAAQRRAGHTVEEFRKMGIDPTWDRLAAAAPATSVPPALTAEQEAERELNALLDGDEDEA